MRVSPTLPLLKRNLKKIIESTFVLHNIYIILFN